MKASNFTLKRYDADEGKVFDWKYTVNHTHEEPIDPEHPEGEKKKVIDHLYAKTLWIGEYDSIDNYVEVKKQ